MSNRSSKRAMKGTLLTVNETLSTTTVNSIDRNVNGNISQLQNVKTARVYVFGEGDVDDEEALNDDIDTYELRVRGKSKITREDEEKESLLVSIERPILEGETLQKIAVKYCCELADLKRVNNLITDQDFYALTTIKVPVMRHSLVRENLEKELRENAGTNDIEHINGAAVPIGAISKNRHSVLEVTEANISDNEWADIDNDSETTELLVRTVSIRNCMTNQGEEAKSFLQRMDADIKGILSSTASSKKRNLEEVRNSLTCRRVYPLNRKEGFLGADCGLKMGTIISVIIIIAIVTPLVYFIYYEYMKPPERYPTSRTPITNGS